MIFPLTIRNSAFVALCMYVFNPLALELDILTVAHRLGKILIFYEPKKVLWNTRHSVEE